MRLVYDSRVAEWVADRIPHVRDFGECAAIGVVTDRLIAGVVYNEFYPEYGTVQLSMAADSSRWARRETIAGLLAYPFLQMNVYKVWTATPLDNGMALRVNEKIGFKQEATLAHHFGRKRHAVIRRMFKPQFLKLYGEYYGQERTLATSRA